MIHYKQTSSRLLNTKILQARNNTKPITHQTKTTKSNSAIIEANRIVSNANKSFTNQTSNKPSEIPALIY